MSWQYVRRKDGLIAVTLDNNVWDFLFERNINLAQELPAHEFIVFITREVEIESMAIPVVGTKVAFKDYIDRTINLCGIGTISVFGFDRDGPGPQRFGGFGQGTFQSQTEIDFYKEVGPLYLCGRAKRNSELTTNEGDAAVAARSFSSIVLTCEKANKAGPLRFAAKHGGKILYLREADQSGLTLKARVTALHNL